MILKTNNQEHLLYESPQMMVFSVELTNSILIASNEGIGYEDLFLSSESVIQNEPINILF